MALRSLSRLAENRPSGTACVTWSLNVSMPDPVEGGELAQEEL